MATSIVIRRVAIGLLGVCIILLILPLGFGQSSQVPLIVLTDLGIKIHGGSPTVRVGTYGYCVSINPSSGLVDTCFDPSYDYDITNLEFKTPNGTTYFGADTAKNDITSARARQYTKVTGALHPLSLSLNVIAGIFLIRSLNPVYIAPSILLSLCFTAVNIGIDIMWLNNLKSYFWQVKGGEVATHRGSGAYGAALYSIIVALFIQFVACVLTLIFCWLTRNEQKSKLKQQRQQNRDSTATEVMVYNEFTGKWEPSVEMGAVSSGKNV